MDINIQRELDSIQSLLNVSNSEKKQLEQKANNFITEELVNINNNKEKELFLRINNILEQICNELHQEFNIDKVKLNNIFKNHKFNILYNSDSENYIENTISNSDSDSDSDSDNDNGSDNDSDKEKNKKIDKKDEVNVTKKDIDKKENNDVLTGPIKCPAAKRNGCSELCGRLTIKACNFMYCGYHKKYFKE